MNRLTSVWLAAMLAFFPAAAIPAEKAVSIVLVHGAFVDASGWESVYKLLSDDGYEVLIVQNPTITLEGDVAATKRAIAAASHPVVLVGHSYGGMVITEAGNEPNVQRLVYLAAYVPDVGESVYSLASQPAAPDEPRAPLLPPQDGFLIVDPAQFPVAFAADVHMATTRFMAAAQVPWGLAAVQAEIAAAAWKEKPAYFLLTTQDRMIPPSAQRAMAQRAKARILELASSHAVMLSHPRDVADFIAKAATEPR